MHLQVCTVEEPHLLALHGAYYCGYITITGRDQDPPQPDAGGARRRPATA
ncbi:hypothetical protein [Saccharothrix deserti]|nr:hypothetical protein [Saccharothrix deserti]